MGKLDYKGTCGNIQGYGVSYASFYIQMHFNVCKLYLNKLNTCSSYGDQNEL